MNDEPIRVIRGGGWINDAAYARVARRIRSDPGDRSPYLGVRLIRVICPLQQIADVHNGR